KASTAGNICTSRMKSRPKRRPVQRSREKAYAAAAPRSRVAAVATTQMMSELRYQVQYGRAGSLRSASKLRRPGRVGSRPDVDSVPALLKAEETMKRMGKSAKASASRASACRHQTSLKEPLRGLVLTS